MRKKVQFRILLVFFVILLVACQTPPAQTNISAVDVVTRLPATEQIVILPTATAINAVVPAETISIQITVVANNAIITTWVAYCLPQDIHLSWKPIGQVYDANQISISGFSKLEYYFQDDNWGSSCNSEEMLLVGFDAGGTQFYQYFKFDKTLHMAE